MIRKAIIAFLTLGTCTLLVIYVISYFTDITWNGGPRATGLPPFCFQALNGSVAIYVRHEPDAKWSYDPFELSLAGCTVVTQVERQRFCIACGRLRLPVPRTQGQASTQALADLAAIIARLSQTHAQAPTPGSAGLAASIALLSQRPCVCGTSELVYWHMRIIGLNSGAALLVISLLAAYPVIVFIPTPSRRRKRWQKEGRCIHCGYDLTGNVSGTCPECGAKVPTP